LPVLDSLLTELERRFDATNCNAMIGIQALNPSSKNFADFGCIREFAEVFKADVTDLMHELHQAQRLVQRMSDDSKPTTLVSFMSYLGRYKEAFPELYRLGTIAIALPVSTASCERSFSALRHIKTWVRNSISNNKLLSVSILAIERERAVCLQTDKIIDAFAAAL
jgi:hypothetical protein